MFTLQIIPAHGNIRATVKFAPSVVEDVFGDIDCTSYALAYLTIDEKVFNFVIQSNFFSCIIRYLACHTFNCVVQFYEVANRVSRKDGYSVTPLRLDMVGQVRPA